MSESLPEFNDPAYTDLVAEAFRILDNGGLDAVRAIAIPPEYTSRSEYSRSQFAAHLLTTAVYYVGIDPEKADVVVSLLHHISRQRVFNSTGNPISFHRYFEGADNLARMTHVALDHLYAQDSISARGWQTLLVRLLAFHPPLRLVDQEDRLLSELTRNKPLRRSFLGDPENLPGLARLVYDQYISELSKLDLDSLLRVDASAIQQIISPPKRGKAITILYNILGRLISRNTNPSMGPLYAGYLEEMGRYWPPGEFPETRSDILFEAAVQETISAQRPAQALVTIQALTHRSHQKQGLTYQDFRGGCVDTLLVSIETASDYDALDSLARRAGWPDSGFMGFIHEIIRETQRQQSLPHHDDEGVRPWTDTQLSDLWFGLFNHGLRLSHASIANQAYRSGTVYDAHFLGGEWNDLRSNTSKPRIDYVATAIAKIINNYLGAWEDTANDEIGDINSLEAIHDILDPLKEDMQWAPLRGGIARHIRRTSAEPAMGISQRVGIDRAESADNILEIYVDGPGARTDLKNPAVGDLPRPSQYRR